MPTPAPVDVDRAPLLAYLGAAAEFEHGFHDRSVTIEPLGRFAARIEESAPSALASICPPELYAEAVAEVARRSDLYRRWAAVLGLGEECVEPMAAANASVAHDLTVGLLPCR